MSNEASTEKLLPSPTHWTQTSWAIRHLSVLPTPPSVQAGGNETVTRKGGVMRRRTFDTLMTTGGLVVTVVLLVAGALLFVGYNFANKSVNKQLVAQHITMPSGQAIADPAIHPYLAKYAGQQMANGAQAQAYADHFIA